jgi:hypothetical protein
VFNGFLLYWAAYGPDSHSHMEGLILAVVTIPAITVIVVLSRKARGRELGWSYYIPPGIPALCILALFAAAGARETKEAEARRQWELERNELRKQLEDPNVLPPGGKTTALHQKSPYRLLKIPVAPERNASKTSSRLEESSRTMTGM